MKISITKKGLTEDTCLAQNAKDRDNIVTTDASKIGLGITLWQKQSDGEIKPIEFGSRYLNESKGKNSIEELELLAVVWGLEKLGPDVIYTERKSFLHRPSST